MEEVILPTVAQQSAAYKLFNYPYLWSYAGNEAYDDNDTEYFGRVTSGDEELDYRIATADTERYNTVSEAAEIISRGVGISLVDPNDSIVIYKLIKQHMNDWHKHVSRPGPFSRVKDVPITGLREFNTLAKHLMVIGRRHGLIDLFDPYLKERSRRTFSRGYRPKVNLAEVNHPDSIFNSIVSFAKERKKEAR